MDNSQTGLDAWKKFYNYLKMYHGNKVNYSFDEMMNSYGAKKNIFISGWGDMIVNGSVASSRLESALIALAKDSQGRMLKNPIQVSNYIQNQATKIDWIEAIAYVATESTKDVINAAADVGDSLILTGKILTWLLPIIVIGGLFIYANEKSGGRVMKGVRNLKK